MWPDIGTKEAKVEPLQGSQKWRGLWRELEEHELTELEAPLEYPRATCEVMVDVMSVTRHFQRKQQKMNDHLDVVTDVHSTWPLRVFYAAEALSKVYGQDRPPSPWQPVINVHELPRTGVSYKRGGRTIHPNELKVQRWKSLKRQGPRDVSNVTMAFASTYVDRFVEDGDQKADKEILYMLEILTRDFPRRQVLVTDDENLRPDASRYATIRSCEWFEREVRRTGEQGEDALRYLDGDCHDLDRIYGMYRFAPQLIKAFEHMDG